MNLSLILAEVTAQAPQLDHFIGQFMNLLNQNIANFGWTVVVFTIILKLILSPLDIWQKLAQRKQSRNMARIQPKLAKLQKQYANRPDILKQKQAELYRAEKIGMGGMIGMCLPTIITMIIFFVVFAGFQAMVRYENEMLVYNIAVAYEDALAAGTPLTPEQLAAMYQPQSWLWIENVFMPDTWANVIPDYEQFVGTGIGNIGASKPDFINMPDWYSTLIGPAMAEYNKVSIGNGTKWNGYFVLPILSIAITLISTKLMQSLGGNQQMAGTEEQQQNSKRTMKVMMIIMPVMMGIFSLFYSAAFSLYIITNSLISTITGLAFNLFFKIKDKKAEANSPAIR